MASQDRPPPPSRRPSPPPSKPGFDLGNFDFGKIDFDPRRLRLPQAAIVGFAIGIFFHACVVFAVLDDGSSAGSSPSNSGPVDEPRQEATIPAVTSTVDPRADRNDCNAIRTTGDYRSETERQWFLANCTGQQQTSPTQAAPAAATATRTP